MSFAAGLWGLVVVLYHCCMSVRKAEAIVRDGFEKDAFIPVTESSPYLNGGTSAESHAVVMLGLPFGFSLSDYQSHTNRQGVQEYLVPAAVLNALQRAIWPR